MTELNPQVYLNAIAAIEQYGWGQGKSINQAGNLCALGAIRVALGEVPYEFVYNLYDGEENTAVALTRFHVPEAFEYSVVTDEIIRDLNPDEDNPFDDRYTYTTEWNDTVATEEDVKRVLRLAAQHVATKKENVNV